MTSDTTMMDSLTRRIRVTLVASPLGRFLFERLRQGWRAIVKAKHSPLFLLYRLVLRFAPRNRSGDYLVSLVHFVWRHKRWPGRKSALFNDALFRMKTSDEILDPLRVFVTDKEFVKLYVTAIVGADHVVPTLAVLRSPKEATTYPYPPDCVIKPTHSGGEIIIREGDTPIDHAKIQRWFASNAYELGREANYRFLKPKVIVEPKVFGRSQVNDYKVFCLNGVPKAIQVDVDRFTHHKRTLYTPDWQLLPFGLEEPLGVELPRPEGLHELLEVVAKVAQGLGFVRMDLYVNDKQVLVGEITNCHGNAGQRFIPTSAEAVFSRLLFGDGEQRQVKAKVKADPMTEDGRRVTNDQEPRTKN